jgi:3-hydroxyisobutyrate dehydrogenase-like beta-hydroxyacid dehydrogenase
MTTTGFIGLGVMGRPMAANPVRAGYGVVGYSRRADPGVRPGGRGARVSLRSPPSQMS